MEAKKESERHQEGGKEQKRDVQGSDCISIVKHMFSKVWTSSLERQIARDRSKIDVRTFKNIELTIGKPTCL